MSKNTSSPFPTMGKGGPPVRVAPVTSNLKTSVKKGSSKGGAGAYGMLDGIMAHRTGIQERMGAQCRVTAKLYSPNAVEAAQTGRRTVRVPSAIGNRDFYDARRRAGN